MLKIVTHYGRITIKVILIFLVLLPFCVQAQSVRRYVISSYSSTGVSGSVPYEQTAGQPYFTAASYNNKAVVLPGFQQPVVYKFENMNSGTLSPIRLNVYPNPATNSVIIQAAEQIDDPVLRVTDVNGKLILAENKILLQNYILDCAGWPDGIYFITVSGKNQNRTSVKLIITK